MTTLNEYIARIENHDITLININLMNSGLNNDDANRLMNALRNAPEVAIRITDLNLGFNRLTCINLPAELIALRNLILSSNQLTSINIPSEFVALRLLDLDYNVLTSINLPSELIALQQVALGCNQLTSINISAELISLRSLRLNNNQLTYINIPAGLIALQRLQLEYNQLTSINIPGELIALQHFCIAFNQVTSINISSKLIALRVLDFKDNQLTSINIPAELIALQYMGFDNNQLTIATKLALCAFRATMPEININGIDNNIAEELTPAILNEHFQTRVSLFLFSIEPSVYKGIVFPIRNMPIEMILLVTKFIIDNNTPLLIREDIAMLKRCFANDEAKTATLNKWLSSPEMKGIEELIVNKALNDKINSLLKIYEINTKKVLDMRQMPDKKAMIASSVAALTWKHRPSYGLSDNTLMDPAQNPCQLARRPAV
jgi:hypothetical protein